MPSSQDYEKKFNPYKAERIRLSTELNKAIETENYAYASKYADDLHALTLKTSLVIAGFISDLEKISGEAPYIPVVIENAKRCYAELNDTLRRIQKIQQKYRAINN